MSRYPIAIALLAIGGVNPACAEHEPAKTFTSRADLEIHSKRVLSAIAKKSIPFANVMSLNVVEAYDVPDDGNRDAAAPINKAITAAAGRALYIPRGVYLLERSITPVSDTTLYISPDAEMRRGFDGPNVGTRGALLQGAASGRIARVRIHGGKWTNPGNKYSGRVFGIVGNKWTIDGVRVTGWGNAEKSSICMSVVGDDIVVRDSHMTGSAKRLGQAAIRVIAGERIKVSDCYVEAGDDAFCAFPVEAARQHAAGRPIRDVLFERCYGLSYHARFGACGLTAINSMRKRGVAIDKLNNASVSKIKYVDCAGLSLAEKSHGPAYFVICANPGEGASVRDVSFVNCQGIGSETSDQCVKVSCIKGAVCSTVSFERCRFLGGCRGTVTVARTCRDVSFTDCVVGGRPFNKQW